LKADHLYYNEGLESGLSDWQYDQLKEALIERDPNYVPEIGAPIREGENRVKLPYWLGSMDKLKPSSTREFEQWYKDHRAKSYIVEDKLDGVSCLLVVKNGELKLYTRGNGVVGADISYLAPYLPSVPKDLEKDLSVRGELIISKKVFEKKYSSDYANPRNLVAGITGAKRIRRGLTDVQFIAYEMVGKGKMSSPSEQLAELEALGFSVVRHEFVPELSLEELMSMFIRFKETSPFEIDGIIIQPNTPYLRNTSGNPSYAFAFKMRLDDNLVQADVIQVIWTVSKWGQLKPRIQLVPTRLGGVTISYATGFNAKYINDHKIGPGAKVEITRSGDVIPYIVSVVQPASEPQMPEVDWQWNPTKVDALAISGFGSEMCIKLIHSFFSQLGFKQLGQKSIEKMYNSGLNSILKILVTSQRELVDVAKFGAGEAKVIMESLRHGLEKGLELSHVLGVSSVLGQGIGKRKVKALLLALPTLLEDYKTLSLEDSIMRINGVSGFGLNTATTIAVNLPWADRWIQVLEQLTTLHGPVKHRAKGKGTLSGSSVIITGTLSGMTRKEAEAAIEHAGGVLATSVKNPKSSVLKQIVVVADPNSTSSKARSARKWGLRLYSESEFLDLL
jgi:NAD-dependent DNA ligase